MPLTALQHYWSGTFLTANAFIALNVVGALLLGVLIGYERSYQGRAAGMRTYGLVCMASLSWLHRIQRRLPRRATLDCVLTFQAGYRPSLDEVAAASEARGYQLIRDSLAISYVDAQLVWQFALISMERKRPLAPAALADELADFPGLVRFVLTPVQM